MSILTTLKSLFGNTKIIYGYTNEELPMVNGYSPRELFATQSNLHTVITFLANNISQLPLKVYKRVDDNKRQRDRDSNISKLLYQPNTDQTAFEFWYALCVEYFLYGEAIVWLLPSLTSDSGFEMRIIPSDWVVDKKQTTNFAYDSIKVKSNTNGQNIEISSDQLIIFKMYSPSNPSGYQSPVSSLKQTLTEQIQANKFRTKLWKSSGRLNSYISRPANVQPWSKETRENWVESFRKGWSADGSKAGAMPILEDGMEIKPYQFNSKEAQYIESIQLSREEVCGAYGVKPSLIWSSSQTYASAKDNARALYSDCLGPVLQMFQQRINTFLIPKVTNNNNLYVVFDLDEKLKGSFEERASYYQSACGVPYLTVNEVRADLDKPPVEGGDERVIPLNVLIGGQASPQDSTPNDYDYDGVDNRAKNVKKIVYPKRISIDTEPTDDDKDLFSKTISKFIERQSKTIINKLGVKDIEEWWDKERWDKELAEDLLPILRQVSERKGKSIANELSSLYNSNQTEEYLKKLAQVHAELINDGTKAKIDNFYNTPTVEVIEEDGEVEEPKTINDVFEKRKSFDSVILGVGLAYVAYRFATNEAINQAEYQGKVQRKNCYKVWITGSNPRDSHASMNGERVGIDDVFSNGARWVHDFGSPDDVCGCNCKIQTEIEIF